MKLKININRSLRTCTIAIILFALLFSTILTIPSFNVLAQNQSAAPLNETETETEAEIETGNETDVEDETKPEAEPEEIISPNNDTSTPEPEDASLIAQNQTDASLNETETEIEAEIETGNETDVEDESKPEAEPEEIISANFANASLITDKSTYSPGESVNISLLYVPSTATVNLAIISPDDIVYIALAQETGVYSFTETTEVGTYLISANLSFALELENETETETKTLTLTLTKEFEVVGEEGKEIGEGLKEKGEERSFDLNKASLSVDKTAYALGETVRICLAAPPEVIDNFSIINPAGIFYAILPSADGEYEFKPDSAGNYVVNVSLRTSAGSDEKFLILTAEFDVMDLGLEIVFEEPEQGEIEVGEPVNWTQHISITNHGNVPISNYSLTIPLPDDYSNLSSDFYNHKITQISTRNCGDAGCKMQDAIINLSPITHHPSLITPTLILIALAPGENLSFNIFYQTSPVELEVVEASIDISDLIPPDAFDVGIYKEIGTGEEELKEVSSLSLTESEVKVKQVTVLHNSSVHYHNIPVCIEAEEEDTKVVELVNGTEKEIKAEISDKNASWVVPELSNRTFMITKREYIPEQAKAEIDKPVEWQLNFSGTIIKYKTPAPFKTESAPKIENGTWKKEITIGSNASVHYSNVTAFTNLSLEKKALPKKQQLEEGNIKLFLINLSSGGKGGRRIDVTDNPAYNVSFVDTDDNGLIDKVQWNVPFLSNKTFEVEQRIEVINVQSYPTVGGNWTAMFNTTGTANLTITAVNGTTWSNINEDNDLKFLEIKCGDNLLDYQWINNSVFIENYSCDETGYEISTVLTSGKHTLEFRFGTDVEYAHNLAGEWVWTDELLTNPGAETGDNTGWTFTGTGSIGGHTQCSWCDCGPRTGSYYWWVQSGGTDSENSQNVSLSAYASYIDAGNAVINATCWLGCGESASCYDKNRLIIKFYNSTGDEMSAYTNDSGWFCTGAWVQKGLLNYTIPVGARKVQISPGAYESGWDAGAWDDCSVKVGYVDTTPPTYSDNSTNSTVAGTPIEHRLKWEDNVNLSGYIFRFCNGTWNGTDCTVKSLNILLLCGNSGCTDSNKDVPLKNYLNVTLGHTVTTHDASETSTSSYDVVVISESVSSGNTAWIKDDPVGILTVEGANNDELDLGTGGSSNGGGDTECYINNSHYITSVFSSGIRTLTSVTTNLGYMSGWSNDVKMYVHYNSSPTYAKLLVVEKDGTLVDSTTAAERRVFFGVQYFNNLNDDGKTIFNRALNWTAYNTEGQGWVNDTWVSMTGAINWSNVTKTVNSTVGAKIAWCVYANDTSDNWNGTSCDNPFSYVTTTSADTAPTYSNDEDDSESPVREGTVVNISVLWDDNIALSKGVLRTNKTGTWQNETWHDFTATPQWFNATINTSGYENQTICWVQWANDTSNNWNTSMSTAVHCFDVSWWNTNYQYRKKITVSSNDSVAVPVGYSVWFDEDTATLIANNKLRSDGKDWRVVWWNSSAKEWIELDRWVDEDEGQGGGWNSAHTHTWFKAQAAIPSGSSDDNYYAYYGYPDETGTPPAQMSDSMGADTPKSKVFLAADDFEEHAVDDFSDGWTNQTGCPDMKVKEDSGKIFNDGTGGGGYCYADENYTYADIAFRMRAKQISASTSHMGMAVRNKDSTCNDLLYLGYSDATHVQVWRRVGGGYTQQNSWGISDIGTAWHTLEIRIKGTAYKVYHNGSYLGSGSYTNESDGGVALFCSYSKEGHRDNFIVRKYVDSEPLTSVGSEEVGDFTQLGWLDVTLLTPDPSVYNDTNPKEVNQYETFWVNATVSCEGQSGATCGVANGTVRHNQSWWNTSWQYREQINITNNNATTVLEAGYSVNITTDTTGDKFMDNGNDLRIVYWNGTTHTELDRVNETAFNSTSTEIWFKIQSNIPANSYDDNYYLYYGNPSAASPPADRNEVYLFWDDFNRADGDLGSEYTKEGAGNWGVVSNELRQSTTGAFTGVYITAGTSWTDVIITNKWIWTGASCSDSGPIFRWQGGSSGWYLERRTGGVYLLIRPSNSQYDSASMSSPGTAWHNHTTIVYGNNVKFYEDGTLYIDYDGITGNGWSDGSGGVATYCGAYPYRFDDLKVRKYIDPEPSTSLGSEEEQIKAISTTTGATPFYTINNQPQSCGSMTQGQSCQLNWTVNATGEINSVWKIDVRFTSNESQVAANDTDDATVKIYVTPSVTDLRVVNVTFDNWETGENKASVSETGTGYHIKEGRNITVNATIANYGNGNVTSNFNVSFFDCAGVYGNWSKWFGNYTYNVTEKGQLGNASTGYPHNTTYAIVYWDPSLVGTHNISAWADPENTLGEASGNLTNNNGSALINVSAWQKYWGNVSGNIVLAGSAGDNMSTWDWPAGSIGNLYIVNHGATINWTALQALGRDKTGSGAGTTDFADADINLGMNAGSNNATGFTNNNITELFSTDGAGASARNTTNFTVYGKLINNVPIINSTDMTNHTDVANAIFKTGILWDTSDDDGDGEYDTTDKEDLVFIANIRYDVSDIDYKITIPCALNAAIGGELDFYVELR